MDDLVSSLIVVCRYIPSFEDKYSIVSTSSLLFLKVKDVNDLKVMLEISFTFLSVV